MESAPGLIGLIVIIVLYISIGFMSVAGSIYIAKAVFTPRAEQIFFALFLMPIAGFYLAFADYFAADGAWQLETTAVLVFCGFALVGIRMPAFLILGYLLHGIWDGIHEYNTHAGAALLGEGKTTAVPLAYGFFCATYDVLMSVYFFARRKAWTAAWRGETAAE